MWNLKYKDKNSRVSRDTSIVDRRPFFLKMIILRKKLLDFKFLTHKEHKMQRITLRDVLQKQLFHKNPF